MKLKVTLPGEYTIFNLTDASTFIAALSNSISVRIEGWGDNAKHIRVKEAPTLTIVADDYGVEDLPPPLVELQAQLRVSENRWLEHYNKSQALAKELKETKAELEKIRAAVSTGSVSEPNPPSGV